MTGRDIITIGASAGGVEAMIQLVRELPPDLPASIFLTIHIPAFGSSMLPEILSRKGPLRAIHPQDGDAIEHGKIYIAPPDRHLLVKRGRVRLASGPRENSARPSIDPMFRTAARAYGPRVVAVVLTGTLDDGTAGLLAVKRHNGIAVVHDPGDAVYPDMPRSAIEHADVDYVLPLAEIPQCLRELTGRPISEAADHEYANAEETIDLAEMTMEAIRSTGPNGTPAGFSCPECGGTLWESKTDGFPHFRCRVGHAFSSNSLLAEQGQMLEIALWSALRALEENAALARRTAERMRDRQRGGLVERFLEQARDAEQRASVIRGVLDGAPLARTGET